LTVPLGHDPAAWGLREEHGRRYLSADRYAESLLPHAVSLLNDLMAATAVEQFARVDQHKLMTPSSKRAVAEAARGHVQLRDPPPPHVPQRLLAVVPLDPHTPTPTPFKAEGRPFTSAKASVVNRARSAIKSCSRRRKADC